MNLSLLPEAWFLGWGCAIKFHISQCCEDVVGAECQRELLRVWSCVVTWRVWHSTAKAIYLNLTLDGQLWVEACGSDVVGGKLDPSGTAGALSPACLVASWSWSRWGRPWSGLAYRGLSAPRTTSDTLVHVALWCGLVNDHWLLCLCVCWVIFQRDPWAEQRRCIC